MSIVLDAWVALAAVLPDELSAYAIAAFEAAIVEGLVVPVLWLYEGQNALLMAQRRQRIDEPTARDAIVVLQKIQARFETPRSSGEEYTMAKRLGLTAYDAAYVVVARTNDARLATFDKSLIRAAKKAEIPLFAVQ